MPTPQLVSMPEPEKRTPQQIDEALITKLKNRIWRLWSRNHRQRYLLGKFLKQLHEARSHYGHGSYMDDLQELDITYSTARRLIIYHEQTRIKFAEHLDYKPIRCLQNEKNGSVWEIVDVAALEQAMEQGVADKEIDELRELIEKEGAKIATFKKNKDKRTPDYRVTLNLSGKRRERFKDAWLSMTERLRTKIVYEAVTNACDKT